MGRSYLGPPDNGIRQVLFAGREQDGVPSPLCYHLALAGCGFPGCRPGLFHFTDIFFKTAADHHRHRRSLDLFKYGSGGGMHLSQTPRRSLDLFKYGSGGGMHLSQTPRIMHKGRIIYAKRNQRGCGQVGVGWECSPTTLVT